MMLCSSKIRSGLRRYFGTASSKTFLWATCCARACKLQSEAESLLAEAEYEFDSETVLGLVRDSDCSAYDCELIALAIKLNTKLVTIDKKLLKAFAERVLALNAG